MNWLSGLVLRLNLMFASLRHRDQKDVEYYLEEFNGDLRPVPANKSKGKPREDKLFVKTDGFYIDESGDATMKELPVRND